MAGLRNLQRQAFVQFPNGNACIDQAAAIGVGYDCIDFDIVLVLNLTDDLLDQVLDGHDALNAAVLVHNDAHVRLRVLQHADGVVHLRRVGNEDGFPQQLRKPESAAGSECRA